MRKGRSTGKPTTEQVARFEAIHRLGCIACRKRGHVTPCEVHHLTVGGRHGQKRRGHDFTVGLCSYHHRGLIPQGWTSSQMLAHFGPSYARQPRTFREVFGDDHMLMTYQQALIDGDDRFTVAA